MGIYSTIEFTREEALGVLKEALEGDISDKQLGFYMDVYLEPQGGNCSIVSKKGGGEMITSHDALKRGLEPPNFDIICKCGESRRFGFAKDWFDIMPCPKCKAYGISSLKGGTWPQHDRSAFCDNCQSYWPSGGDVGECRINPPGLKGFPAVGNDVWCAQWLGDD